MEALSGDGFPRRRSRIVSLAEMTKPEREQYLKEMERPLDERVEDMRRLLLDDSLLSPEALAARTEANRRAEAERERGRQRKAQRATRRQPVGKKRARRRG